MEAGPGYKMMENGGNSAPYNMTISKFAPWNGNWHRWRATMEAAADLQGVGEAVQAGIAIAANEKATISDIALGQSKKLSSMLLLALSTGDEGVQNAIAREAFYNNRNGIEAVVEIWTNISSILHIVCGYTEKGVHFYVVHQI